MEKWKIQSNIEKIERGGNTNFLNKKDIHTITKILDKRNVKYQVFVPYEEAEKQIIYGNPVKIVKPEEFSEILKDKSKRVTTGFDENGDKVLMLAIDAEYPMEGNKKSSSLVVALPMSSLIRIK